MLIFFISCAARPQKTHPPPSEKEPVSEKPVQQTPAEKKPESAAELLISLYTGPEDSAKAIETLEQADVFSMDAESRLIYATLLQESGRTEDARTELEKLVNENPDMARAWFQLSLLEHSKGNTSLRDSALKETLKADPNMTEAWVLQGKLAAKNDDWALAENSYTTALKLEPENPEAMAGLAWVYAKNGKLDEALALLDKAVNLNPDFAYAWADRSRVNVALSNYADAEDDIDKAIAINPDVPWHYLDRARLRLTYFKNYDGALSDLNTVERLNPGNFLAMVYLGGLHDELRNFAMSEAYYKKVIAAHSDYKWAYMPLGKFAWMRGNYNEAYRWFTNAAAVDPNEFSFQLMAALSLLKMEKTEEFKQTMSKVIKPFKPGNTTYEVLRFCQEPKSDFFAVGALNKESDKKLREQLWFYMGVMYEIEGNTVASQTVYARISENHGKMEFDMAWAALHGMGDIN